MKVTVPENKNDIAVEQWQKFGKYMDNNPNATELQLQVKAIELFCNLTEQIVKAMSSQDVDTYGGNILEILKEEDEFLQTFKIGDIEYGFIPNLNKMTAGEMIDLESYANGHLHLFAGACYRPIKQKLGDKYLIEDYTGDEGGLLQAPISAVLGAKVFFWNLGRDLITNMKGCLTEEDLKVLPQELISQLNGAGV